MNNPIFINPLFVNNNKECLSMTKHPCLIVPEAAKIYTGLVSRSPEFHRNVFFSPCFTGILPVFHEFSIKLLQTLEFSPERRKVAFFHRSA